MRAARLLALVALSAISSASPAFSQSEDTTTTGATISGTIYLAVDSTRQATTIIATMAGASVRLYAPSATVAPAEPNPIAKQMYNQKYNPDSTLTHGYTRVGRTGSSTVGTYTLTNVPPGQYLVVVRHTDYPERSATIQITEARAYRLDFYPPGDLRQIGETLLAPIRKSD
ncbi:MAG: hypothetical protein RhofKO_06370 [Rhodothermales bacterium]